MKSLLIILFFSLSALASGQSKADKELKQYLIRYKLDTFILVKTGCQTCEISYEKNLKNVDTLTILLLYKKYGQITLVYFSDTSKSKQFDNIYSDIFQIIEARKTVLKQADIYYKEQELAKFQAPCFAIFPYEKINIQIGKFRHKHTLVMRELDDCGTNLTKEDWFKAELEILGLLDTIKYAN